MNQVTFITDRNAVTFEKQINATLSQLHETDRYVINIEYKCIEDIKYGPGASGHNILFTALIHSAEDEFDETYEV